MVMNEDIHNCSQCREQETVGHPPQKGHLYDNPILPKLRNIMKEETERLQEADVVDDCNETVSPRPYWAISHMNAQWL